MECISNELKLKELGLTEKVRILPFSSERRVYSDDVWSELEKYI